MKTYWGSGGIAPRTFKFDTRCMWVVSFTLRPPCSRRLHAPRSHFTDEGLGFESCSRRVSSDASSLM